MITGKSDSIQSPKIVSRNVGVFLPSSSVSYKNDLYLNFMAERTGVSFYPHQVEGAGSIPASDKMKGI